MLEISKGQIKARVGWLEKLLERVDRYIRSLPMVLHIAAIVAVGLWVAIADQGAWMVLAAIVLSITLILRPGIIVDRMITSVLASLALVSTVNYIGWRVRLINLHGWWIGIPLFAAELFGALHALGLLYTIWPHPLKPLAEVDDPAQMPIFIFIPTVNEGKEVVTPTVLGAIEARDRYTARLPDAQVRIIICNDGYVAGFDRWEEMEELAEDVGVECITRKVGGGAKAGNIENARQMVGATGNSVMIIFDADQVARPDFLRQVMPPFTDPNVGWVQTGQYYGNCENTIARWSHDQQALFYQVLCPGKANLNSAFICGTNVAIRTSALDQLGGLPQDSVTEDFAASIELHPTWRGVFIEGEWATGLGPMDLKSYFSQQRRWAIGTLTILKKKWRKIFLPGGGLTLEQRLQYGLSTTHYISGLRDLIYVLAPIAFLLTGIPAVRGSDLPAFLAHFVPYYVISQLAFWYVVWGKTGLRGIIMGFGSFPILVNALATVIVGHQVGFKVTAKKKISKSDLNLVIPHIFFLILSIIALVVGLRADYEVSVTVSVIWVVYQIALLSISIWLAVAETRVFVRMQDSLSNLWNSLLLRPRVRRPVPGYLRIAAPVLTAIVIGLIAHPTIRSSSAKEFDPGLESTRLQEGVVVPADLLGDHVDLLQTELGRDFTVIGRTQDIYDVFDTEWAVGLAEQNARPWITLLFGQSDKPSPESSLLAIANGVHDDDIRKWSREIRDYGQPVYITILPHVDKNWSISSAVANGGIPQDVTPAWTHVQEIFAEEGALNVAWVWAPASPMQDFDFTPPADTIDVVLLSLIKYPNTDWKNPFTELQALHNRYPDKPLFIEVSVSGPSEEKAAYLTQLGQAVAVTPNITAFLYHEGSPDPQATLADHRSWSVLSDNLSVSAMRQAFESASERVLSSPHDRAETHDYLLQSSD